MLGLGGQFGYEVLEIIQAGLVNIAILEPHHLEMLFDLLEALLLFGDVGGPLHADLVVLLEEAAPAEGAEVQVGDPGLIGLFLLEGALVLDEDGLIALLVDDQGRIEGEELRLLRKLPALGLFIH